MKTQRTPTASTAPRARLLAALGFAAFALSARAQAPQYTVTDLGTLGGAGSAAWSLNDSGQVTGWALNAAGVSHAFFYSGGVMTDIDTLNSPNSGGLSINNAGQIVGDAYYTTNPSNGSYGFLYSGGGMSALSNTVEAHAINNNGQIAGTMIGTSGDTAFLETAGTYQQLGTLVTFQPPISNTSQGDALNNLGQVAGQSAVSTNVGPNPHAFLYTSGTGLIDLNNQDYTTNAESFTGQAFGINDSGQVTGVIDNEAFYFNGTSTVLLGDLGGGNSTALSINNAGEIVGDSFTAANADHAALWIGGTAYDLNNLVTNLAAAGFSDLDTALDINTSGTIVGVGTTTTGQTRAFEAQLVPEPASATLLLTGLLAIAARRRRAKTTPLGIIPLKIRQNHRRLAARHLLPLAALGLACTAHLQAQINVLTNLTNTVPNVTRLTLSPDGNTLYGTTQTVGLKTGTVFSLPVTGGTPTVLGNFSGLNRDGPSGPVTLSGGILYGTDAYGGASNDGTIYSVPVSGGTPTVLTTFSGANGINPAGSLLVAGNILYGTTQAGGANGQGEVFSLPVGGGAPTILTSFSLSDGNPEPGLTLVGSTLYGATNEGTNGIGEIYSLPVTGGTRTLLATFSGTNGSGPVGRLTLSADGTTLFGTTAFGGANSEGTVFSLPLGGGAPTVLASFNGTNGMNPYGSVTQIGSTLYGTTSGGGANDYGEIFSVPVSGGTPTIVAGFNGTTGQYSYSDLTLSADGSTLYGATSAGGSNGDGTLFSIPTPEPASAALLLTGLLAITARRRARSVRTSR